VLHTRVVVGHGAGPEKTIRLTAAALADSCYWPVAAYLHPPDDPSFGFLQQQAAAAGCPLVIVPDRGPIDPRPFWALLRLCRRLGVSIWHAHDYKTDLFGLLLRPFHPMKLVTTLHGWVQMTPRTRLYYALDRRLVRHYDHLICVSDDLHAWARGTGLSPDRCTLLHNAVDEQLFRRRFDPSQSPLRGRYGVPPGRLVVGGIGRLSPEKGFDLLIQAAGLLADDLDFEVWIAGEGPQEAELRQLIEARGLGERVRLLGFCDEPIELYGAIDVLVSSSLREGLPNTALEAMAMKVPIIATRVGGLPHLIQDARTGLLCRPGDVQALAQCLGRMLADPDLRRRLADAARNLIEQKYTLKGRTDGETAVYDHILGRA
jgi:glycosyltransferase involved in cell wall biosynthesis